MSRIRIYELAKEAGMSGKALADKLLELGFDIKGHSSSVDDETAVSIRNALQKSAHSERTEKRVAGEGDRQTVIRRKSTVIRRRPATVVDDASDVEMEAEQPAEAIETKVAEVQAPAVTADAEPHVDVTPQHIAESGITKPPASLRNSCRTEREYADIKTG